MPQSFRTMADANARARSARRRGAPCPHLVDTLPRVFQRASRLQRQPHPGKLRRNQSLRPSIAPAEQPLHKTQHFGDRTERIVQPGREVRQAPRHQFAPPALMHERPERRGAGVRAELLIGELDFDRLTGAFELDFFRHRLVNRVSALRLIRFHSPSISSQSVALFQLHRYSEVLLPSPFHARASTR